MSGAGFVQNSENENTQGIKLIYPTQKNLCENIPFEGTIMSNFGNPENEPVVCARIKDNYRDVLCQNKDIIRKIPSLKSAITMFERELSELKRKERSLGNLADAPTPTSDEIERNILPRDLGKLAQFGALRFARGLAPAVLFSSILGARLKAAQERDRIRAQIESKERLIGKRKTELDNLKGRREQNENNLRIARDAFDVNGCNDALSLHPGPC